MDIALGFRMRRIWVSDDVWHLHPISKVPSALIANGITNLVHFRQEMTVPELPTSFRLDRVSWVSHIDTREAVSEVYISVYLSLI